jgi:hypothetical protein
MFLPKGNDCNRNLNLFFFGNELDLHLALINHSMSESSEKISLKLDYYDEIIAE